MNSSSRGGNKWQLLIAGKNVLHSVYFLCQRTHLEKSITRRAEARTSCWDVPDNAGSHAVSCGRARQYVWYAIIVPGLFFGGTTRPHENIALQNWCESCPVQSPAEAPIHGGWSQASYVAVRRCGSKPPQARSTSTTFESPPESVMTTKSEH